eukprot:424649-Rhodomonas_salina.1
MFFQEQASFLEVSGSRVCCLLLLPVAGSLGACKQATGSGLLSAPGQRCSRSGCCWRRRLSLLAAAWPPGDEFRSGASASWKLKLSPCFSAPASLFVVGG